MTRRFSIVTTPLITVYAIAAVCCYAFARARAVAAGSLFRLFFTDITLTLRLPSLRLRAVDYVVFCFAAMMMNMFFAVCRQIDAPLNQRDPCADFDAARRAAMMPARHTIAIYAAMLCCFARAIIDQRHHVATRCDDCRCFAAREFVPTTVDMRLRYARSSARKDERALRDIAQRWFVYERALRHYAATSFFAVIATLSLPPYATLYGE